MQEKINLLSGSKGGGGSPPAPTITPDNLRSKDTLEIILGISEGPIQGLTDGAKSFFIGDTQLQNQNDEYNFRTFKLNFFPGTDAAQPVITTLGGTTSNNSVNLSLGTNVPVVRQTSTGQIDFFEIRLAIGRLLRSTNSGTFNASLTFRIEYKPLSDTQWIKVYGEDITISGKTSSNYIKEIRQEVDRINEPYELRVTKLSPENTSQYFADVSWESYQEVVATQSAYNNTAVVHLVGEASDQFSSIPAFKGVYDGLLIKVPTNYDPVTRIYSGIWDGSFKVAWTNNPAWILYDYVMNDTYGMRSYYADINLDKYDVYEAAQWCDEAVPDEAGGTQPRYTFNAYITEPRSGRELAKYIAGVFNSTFFDDLNGKAYLRVDKDDQATHLFTQENVLDGSFEYSYVDISARYNDITVTFNNPDLNWAIDRRRVYDQDLIDKNGRIPLDFVAVGCTNKHEAIRRAQHKLITANTETCMLNFTTNRLGQFVNVFDTILISDEDMGYGMSGRIKAVAQDGLSVELRDGVYIEAGVEYTLQLTLKDGSILSVDLKSGHPTGLVYTLELAGALSPNDIPDKTVFSLQNSTTFGLPRPFRVLSVTEEDGQTDVYKISCININRNKWDDADNVTNSGTIDYSVLPDPFDPPGPTSVGFEERYIKNLKQYQITVSPTFPRDTYKYYANDHSFEVWSRLTGSGDSFVKQDIKFGDTLVSHPSGLYDFRILGKSYLGITSRLEATPNYVFDVTNPADPPIDVDWIKINDREVYWGYDQPPSDFAGFRVRYHNQVGRTTWDDAARPHEGLLSNTSFYTNLIPPTARVIMVRAVDDFGTESDNSAIIYRDAGDITLKNVVEQFDFHTSFNGTKVGCTVVSDELIAEDIGNAMYSGNPFTPMYDGGNFYDSSFNEMIYYPVFTSTVDGTLNIDIDSDNNGYEISIQEASSTSWEQVSDGQFLLAGTYTLRIRIFGGSVRGIIRQLSAIIDVDDIEEILSDVSIPATTTALVPTKTFSTIKTVSVIIQNTGSATAVSYRVVSKTPSGPEIELLDSSGAVTSGFVDAIIKGY